MTRILEVVGTGIRMEVEHCEWQLDGTADYGCPFCDGEHSFCTLLNPSRGLCEKCPRVGIPPHCPLPEKK